MWTDLMPNLNIIKAKLPINTPNEKSFCYKCDKCVAYIHYSYANKYVCFYCVSENKSLYEYFG